MNPDETYPMTEPTPTLGQLLASLTSLHAKIDALTLQQAKNKRLIALGVISPKFHEEAPKTDREDSDDQESMNFHFNARKKWRLGQRWQYSKLGSTTWQDCFSSPQWMPFNNYRRHPDEENCAAEGKA